MKDKSAKLTRQVLERLPRALIHQFRNWSETNVFVVEWPPDSIDRVAAVLKQAHALGVGHGDLHGDNILVDEEGAVIVIDWATAVASRICNMAKRGIEVVA